MKINIYAIYDTAAAAYMRPFFTQADGQAIRSFSDIAQDAEHEVGKHPEHYSLHRIGDYNDNTGVVTGTDKECLTTALEALANAKKVNTHNVMQFDKDIKQGTTQ